MNKNKYLPWMLLFSSLFLVLVLLWLPKRNFSPLATKAQTNPLDSLQPGQWYDIPNSHLASVLQSPPPPPGYGGPTAIMASWSSAAYDTKRDQLIIPAQGGHADYSGNEVYSFNLSTLTWSRIRDASPLIPTLGSYPLYYPSYYSDGTPASVHGYDGVIYVPSIDKTMIFGGSRWADGGSTLYRFQLDDSTTPASWTKMTYDSNLNWLGNATSYDPVTGHVWIRTYNELNEYDPATDTMTARTLQDAGIGWGTKLVVDPVRRKAVLFGYGTLLQPGQIFVYDLSLSGTIPEQVVTTTGDTTMTAFHAPGGAYDPTIGAIVAWLASDSNTLQPYELNLDTYVWTKLPTSGSVVPTLSATNGTFGRWVYVPSKDIFLLVNDINQDVFAYRLPGSIQPAPTVSISASPSSITSGQSSTLTWSSTNASSCTASGGWSGTEPTSGSQSVSPTNTTTYTITCTGSGGSASQSVTITVSAPPPPTQINLPLKQWIAVPAGGPFKNGTKHVIAEYNPDNGRIYFNGGDYDSWDGGSYEQQTWSMSTADLFNNQSTPDVAFRLEYDQCGPVGQTSPAPGQVQPKHPDFTGFQWDSIRHLFWFVPGEMVAASEDNCPGETTNGYSDPGFPLEDIMTFNPSANKWADIGPSYNFGNNQWDSVYDNVTDSIIKFYGSAVDTYSVGQNKWTSQDFSSQGLSDWTYLSRLGFDTTNRKIYVMDPFVAHLYSYSIDTKTVADLGAVPGGPLTDCWKQPAITWDSISQVLLFARHPNDSSCPGNFPNGDFEVYHPSTNTWEQISTATNISGIYAAGLVQFFDPGQNVYGLIPREAPYVGYYYLFRYGNGTYTPPNPAPTISLSVSPTSINPGQSATLTWSSANATSCTASGGWSGSIATSGTQSISPTQTTTYTITCTGTGGTTSQSTTLNVTAPAPAPPAITLSYQGKLRDKVGPGILALNPDGTLDGTFLVTLGSNTGSRAVTSLRLDATSGSTSNGIWDTLGTTHWALGVASGLDTPLLNNLTNANVNFSVSNGSTFYVFNEDYNGINPNGVFTTGETLTLTANFSDGSIGTATTVIGGSPPPTPSSTLSNITFIPNVEGQKSMSADTFTLNFYSPATGSAPVYTLTSTGSTILMSQSTLSPGTYDISISTSYHLRRKLTNASLSSNQTITMPLLYAGDLNNDSSINSLDWSLMSAKWFTNDPISDVNQDGIVNSIDFSFMNKNWGKSGD